MTLFHPHTRIPHICPAAKQSNNPTPPTAQIVRLPLFRDGVFIGNEFIPISPRLRTRIRAMAAEGRR